MGAGIPVALLSSWLTLELEVQGTLGREDGGEVGRIRTRWNHNTGLKEAVLVLVASALGAVL